MSTPQYHIGDTLRVKLSGTTGTVDGITEWRTCPNQYCLAHLNKDGELAYAWFMEHDLELLYV